MPRVDFQLWDRVYILKLMCTAQATYSSFVVLIYIYLIVLQDWTTSEADRSDIMKFKWGVIVAGVLEFGLGILLAFAANMSGIRCKLGIVIWIISETFVIPISIFLLMQLQKRLNNSNKYETDTHYSRVNIGFVPAQVCFLLTQYAFIAYAIDFLVQGQRKAKTYDPSIRPKSVYAPTDPQITTTESRHIRMSQSLLFQPTSSRALSKNLEREGIRALDECLKNEVQSRNYGKKLLGSPESEVSRIQKNLEADAKIESFLFKNKKKVYPRQKGWAEEDSKEEWLKEEKTEWLQSEDKEKDQEWTEDEKEWRIDENHWRRDEMEGIKKERDLGENQSLERAELEGGNEETNQKDISSELEEKSGD